VRVEDGHGHVQSAHRKLAVEPEGATRPVTQLHRGDEAVEQDKGEERCLVSTGHHKRQADREQALTDHLSDPTRPSSRC
jgi:hypothetical protein